MSFECNTTKTITSINLNCLAKWALELIIKHLNPNAVRVRSCSTRNIPLINPKSVVSLTSNDLIYELSKEDFDILVGSERPKNKIAFYDPNDGRIYLQEGKWCLRTIIHETLHACSVCAFEPQLYGLHKSFFEALTELYSGYILYKTQQEAYCNCWKQDSKMLCEIRYYNYLIKIAPIFRFIPMNYTYDLYFYKSGSNWNLAITFFVAKIKTHYSNFTNPISVGYSLLDNIFTQFSTIKPEINIIQLQDDVFDFDKII